MAQRRIATQVLLIASLAGGLVFGCQGSNNPASSPNHEGFGPIATDNTDQPAPPDTRSAQANPGWTTTPAATDDTGFQTTVVLHGSRVWIAYIGGANERLKIVRSANTTLTTGAADWGTPYEVDTSAEAYWPAMCETTVAGVKRMVIAYGTDGAGLKVAYAGGTDPPAVGGDWTKSVVDSDPHHGMGNSIVPIKYDTDSKYYVCIAAYDSGDRNLIAYNANSENPGTAGWHSNLIAGSEDVGAYNSLAVFDTNGTCTSHTAYLLGAAFWQESTGTLMYSYSNAFSPSTFFTWTSIGVVDNGEFVSGTDYLGRVGSYCQLLNVDNTPVIYSFDRFNLDLRSTRGAAYNTAAGSWNTAVVSSGNDGGAIGAIVNVNPAACNDDRVYLGFMGDLGTGQSKLLANKSTNSPPTTYDNATSYDADAGGTDDIGYGSQAVMLTGTTRLGISFVNSTQGDIEFAISGTW